MTKNLLIILITLSFFTSHAQDIFDASRAGNTELIKKLVHENPDIVNEANDSGFSPLILATYRNQFQTVNLLLELGADVNYLSQEGTALHAAAYKGQLEYAKLLIENGSDVNLLTEQKMSPLIYAVQSKNIELIQLLVNEGADVSVRDNYGKTAIDYAKMLELTEVFTILTGS